MLLTIYSAREHLTSLTDLANHLGVAPFETPTKDIIGKLLDNVESEVEEYYHPVPFDAEHNPIHVGDTLKEYGLVHGIGNGCVFAGDAIKGENMYGYAIVTAKITNVKKNDGEALKALVTEAVDGGKLNEAQISLIIDYIEGIDDAGKTS